ncbi:cytochrome P450 76T24-like [Bidens hawaiensis]|uniref:cytochrome P450 76T24-like n=1 Tax=Bidens hawaiensis TaxID=980011 RepID=UPI00404B4F09
MDYPSSFLLFSFLLILIYFINISKRHNSRLPPGPYPYPIIGNLLQLTNNPHRDLATLSKRYGPLMSLKLGFRTTIVISSAGMAKEFLKTHDRSFSGRSTRYTARVVDQHKHSMGWLQPGDHWQKLRRIVKEYLISIQHLDASELLRKQKVQELLDHVNQCCTKEKAVNIGGVVFTTSINLLSNIMFSTNFAQYDSESAQEFKDAIRALMEVLGKNSIVDFFPILRPFDPQGLVKHGNVYGNKILSVIDRIIDQRLQTRSGSSSYEGVTSTNNDVLDSLLSLHLKDETEFSRDDMTHLFFENLIAGTDTTSSTMEWAMAELIRNPDKMEKARSEIKLMEGNKNTNDPDFSQLTYLQAIIKETLRLHPPAPLLIPRRSIHDTEIQGFIVPKNAQIFINVWMIGRDPKVWSNPETFMPERFLDLKTDYKGQDFELIPFGAGIRICPGLNIAHRMLPMVLGSLIQRFDWKLEGNMRGQDLDMGEKFGLTIQRSIPLKAIPVRV